MRCYRLWRATQDPKRPRCQVEGCDLPLWAKGYCGPHYQQVQRYGETRPLKRINRGLTRRLTGEYITQNGYRKVYVEERGWLLEHRYVMEQKIGRYLLPDENVHHIDGDRLNNHPDNLELWSKRQPSGQRVEDLVRWAREIIALYGDMYTEGQ